MFFNKKTTQSVGFVWGHKESHQEIVQGVSCRFCPYCVCYVFVSILGQFFKLSQIIFEKCAHFSGWARKRENSSCRCTKSI